MGKDAYWFKHDSNAAFDSKLLRIRAMFGWEGYGIYFGILEILRQQHGYKYPKNDSELQLLSTLLGVDFTRFKNIFYELLSVNLLESNTSHFYSNSLINRMKEWEKQKKNGSKPKSKPNPKPDSKPNRSIRGEEIRVEYMSFLAELNRLTGKKYRGSEKALTGFRSRLADGYCLNDFMVAAKNAVCDQHHIESEFKWLTPEFLVRADKLDKFVNLVEKPKEPVVEINMNDFFGTR